MSDDSKEAGPLPAWTPFGTGMAQSYDIRSGGRPTVHFSEPDWKAPFSDLQPALGESESAADNPVLNKRVNDIPVELEAVIGRAKISVAELMQATEGHEFRLDRRFGEPIELRVNGRTFGYGEIVADDQDHIIGIRLVRLK